MWGLCNTLMIERKINMLDLTSSFALQCFSMGLISLLGGYILVALFQ